MVSAHVHELLKPINFAHAILDIRYVKVDSAKEFSIICFSAPALFNDFVLIYFCSLVLALVRICLVRIVIIEV
jgi:hypothetical protein